MVFPSGSYYLKNNDYPTYVIISFNIICILSIMSS